ncbi:glycosyl hydrolase family 61-domain-containing protein [Mucidula mucida]|nr:glycosyl hydrolase family 61-domain-containing protein [Mucidula mucida]
MIQLSSILFLVSTVSAHTIFQELYVNGVSQPITDVTSNDVICNGGINPYHTPISTTVIPVAAGTQVTAEWHHTLSGADSSDPADPIDASHHGPVMAYLAKVSNATQASVTGLQWFKIWEDGFANGAWGVDRLIANKGKVTFTIPSCIAAGQYLMRVELIALHGAQSYPGAQLYLQITGGGSTSPSTVSFPGAYKGSDPGITINIYYPTVTSYTVPGLKKFSSQNARPAVFSCNAGSAPAPTTPAGSTVQASSTSTAGTPASSGTVAQYGQCGGATYTGPTACIAPFTCVKSSDYYSQCL